MAALDLILDVETEIETSVKAFLTASPYSFTPIASDSATSLTTPRIELVAEVRTWGPHQYVIPSGTYASRRLYDQFGVRLTVELVYQPEDAQGQAALRGRFRRAWTDATAFRAAFAVRGYLTIVGDSLRQVDGGRQIQNGEKTHTLRSVFDLIAVLNPQALIAAS